jgi:glycosyltransferase involved in cell wall biosynthesis
MSEPPLVLSVFATFAVGGPQVRFAAIANHFGRNWRHAIVAMDGNLAARERLDPALDVRFPAIDLRKGDTGGNIRRIRAALRDIGPDVLVTNNWGSIEWAMANVLAPVLAPLARHVHIEDGFGPEERDRQIPRRVWTRRLVLRRVTTVLPSQTLRALARDVWRLPERRLRYIPNGIDLARFSPAPRKAACDVPAGVPVIGTIAALRPEKNLARLLRAFRLVLDRMPAHLVVAGDGPQAAELHDLAGQLALGGHVEFTGHRADPAAELARFDIFALSSDTEQMPISVLEAMATALPIAATAVGDVPAMLSAPNQAYVVPLRGGEAGEALAMALARLAQDGALRASIGDANRRQVEQRFEQGMMFQAYRDVLFPAPGC